MGTEYNSAKNLNATRDLILIEANNASLDLDFKNTRSELN